MQVFLNDYGVALIVVATLLSVLARRGFLLESVGALEIPDLRPATGPLLYEAAGSLCRGFREKQALPRTNQGIEEHSRGIQILAEGAHGPGQENHGGDHDSGRQEPSEQRNEPKYIELEVII